MFPKQLSSYIGKERLFRRLRVAKCLLRKSLAAGALCRHTSDVLLRFPEASLLREFLFQGLFSQGGCIPARRNPFSGIIFPRQKHPCSEKSLFRDYFPETKASLLGEIPFQGLFSQGKSIPARRNPPSGIIFPRRMHPCSEKSPVRDYFPEADASLLGEIPFQGLFSRGECIPARRNLPSGIIFPRRKHPCSRKSPVRDYFPKTKASLLEEIPRQGLFSRGGLFARNHVQNLRRTRRTQANVYQSYLISRRAASFASSAAPEAGAVIPSCAPHYGRNLPVFFPERG